MCVCECVRVTGCGGSRVWLLTAIVLCWCIDVIALPSPLILSCHDGAPSVLFGPLSVRRTASVRPAADQRPKTRKERFKHWCFGFLNNFALPTSAQTERRCYFFDYDWSANLQRAFLIFSKIVTTLGWRGTGRLGVNGRSRLYSRYFIEQLLLATKNYFLIFM